MVVKLKWPIKGMGAKDRRCESRQTVASNTGRNARPNGLNDHENQARSDGHSVEWFRFTSAFNQK